MPFITLPSRQERDKNSPATTACQAINNCGQEICNAYFQRHNPFSDLACRTSEDNLHSLAIRHCKHEPIAPIMAMTVAPMHSKMPPIQEQTTLKWGHQSCVYKKAGDVPHLDSAEDPLQLQGNLVYLYPSNDRSDVVCCPKFHWRRTRVKT